MYFSYRKLVEHRRKVFSEYVKVKSLSPNKQSSRMGAAYSLEENTGIPQQPNRPAPDPPSHGRKLSLLKRLAPEPPTEKKEVPSKIGSELVEQVRIR